MITTLIDQCLQHLASLSYKVTYLTASEEQILLNITEQLQIIVNRVSSFKVSYVYTMQEQQPQNIAQKIKSRIDLYFSYESVDTRELSQHNESNQQCDLCSQQLATQGRKVILLQCAHYFHQPCLEEFLEDNKLLECLNCFKGRNVQKLNPQPDSSKQQIVQQQQIVIPKGDQPPGTMDIRKIPQNCQGFECGSIEISYHIQDSVKNNIKIPGTQRRAYLPDNQEGNELLALLKIAFDNKLIFTIGRSVSRKLDNQLVWNKSIHHKTNFVGGSSKYGYPDPNYLQKLRQELAMKGIK